MINPMSHVQTVPQHLRRFRLDATTGQMVEMKPLTQRQSEKLSKTCSEELSENLTPNYILHMAASKKA